MKIIERNGISIRLLRNASNSLDADNADDADF